MAEHMETRVCKVCGRVFQDMQFDPGQPTEPICEVCLVCLARTSTYWAGRPVTTGQAEEERRE